MFAKDTNSFMSSNMSSIVRVFLKLILKLFLKVPFCVLEGFAILMRNLKSVVQNNRSYLITRVYKPGKVKSNFQRLKNLEEEERKPKLQKYMFFTSCNLIAQHNPLSPSLKTIVRNQLPILCGNQRIFYIFPQNPQNIFPQKVSHTNGIGIEEKFYQHRYFLGIPSKTNVL